MVDRKWYELPNRQSWKVFCSSVPKITLSIVLSSLGTEVQADENNSSVVSDRQTPEAAKDGLVPLYRATPAELQLWIEQLGSPQFGVRERAVQQLARCDASAVEPLRKASEASTDQEVKSRCLAIADAIYDLDVGKRTSAFLKDPDLTKDYGFEGWIPFSEIAGSGRLSKRLFAELIKTNPDLAESSEDNGTNQASSAQREAAEILNKFRTGRNIELGDSISLLYRCIQSEGNVPANVEQITLLLLRTAPLTLEISHPPLRSLLQKLIGRWMQVTKSESSATLIIAIDNDIPESIDIARRVFSNPNCEPNLYRAAIAALMRFGNKDDIVLLESWRSEQRFLQEEIRVAEANPIPVPNSKNNQPQLEFGPQLMFRQPTEYRIYELRYQDLALAASAHLAKREDIRELFPRLQTHPNYVFQQESLAFPQDDQAGRQRVIDALTP